MDTRKLGCNLPEIQTKRQNLRVFCQKDASGKTNSEDPDQTAPLGCRVVRKLCFLLVQKSSAQIRQVFWDVEAHNIMKPEYHSIATLLPD